MGSQHVFSKFRGQTITSYEISDFVLINTPYEKWRIRLKILEKESPSKIVPVSNRKTKVLAYVDDNSIRIRDEELYD